MNEEKLTSFVKPLIQNTHFHVSTPDQKTLLVTNLEHAQADWPEKWRRCKEGDGAGAKKQGDYQNLEYLQNFLLKNKGLFKNAIYFLKVKPKGVDYKNVFETKR